MQNPSDPSGTPAPTIEVHCPKCGESARVTAKALGKKAGCNRCGTVFVLGGAQAAAHSQSHAPAVTSAATSAPPSVRPQARPAQPAATNARPSQPAARIPEPMMMEAPPLATPAAAMMEAPFPDEPIAYASPITYTPPRSSGGRLWMIIGGLAAVILIGAGIWWFTRDAGSNSPAAVAGAGGGGPQTAIRNFKIDRCDRNGMLTFSFETDPATTGIQEMVASLNEDFKEVDKLIDPEYVDGPHSSGAAGVDTRFVLVSKNSTRPNAWSGTVVFPRAYGNLIPSPQKVIFVFRNTQQMISAPLMLSIDFAKGTNEPVALPPNAPQARQSKIGAFLASRGGGGSREFAIDDTTGRVIEEPIGGGVDVVAEGPGSRGILAGDFSPVSAPTAVGRTAGGIEGRWRVVTVGGKPESGSFTFDNDVVTISGKGQTFIAHINLNTGNSTIDMSSEGGRNVVIRYELSGNSLRLYESGSNGQKKDEIVLERE